MPARQTWPESSYCPAAFAGSGVEVGVGEDDERALAAELGRERHEVRAAAARRSRAPVSGEPVKEMRRSAGVSDQLRSDLLADALDDVEHAGRQARPRRRGRRAASTRAATTRPASGSTVQPAASAGAHLPGREHERRVPRRDHDRGPGRHPHDAVARAVRAPVALLVGRREVGVGAEVAGAARDHPGAQRARAASPCRRTRPRRAVDVRVDQVGEPVRGRRAAGGAERRPGRRTRRGRRDGGRRLGRSAARDLARAAARRSGERSSKRSALATRSPPMKWSVETSTPAPCDACPSPRAHSVGARVSRSSTV